MGQLCNAAFNKYNGVSLNRLNYEDWTQSFLSYSMGEADSSIISADLSPILEISMKSYYVLPSVESSNFVI